MKQIIELTLWFGANILQAHYKEVLVQNLAEIGKVIPGIKVKRGGFDLIQVSLRSGEFTDLVPEVPMALPEGPRAQRGYMVPHMRKIATYIAWNSRKWAFGPISLAIHPDRVTWSPLDDSHAGATAEFGTITIHEGSQKTIVILDGQHRAAALAALLGGETKGMQGMNKKLLADAQRSIRNSSLSVDLYLIDNKKDAGQIFADMSRARAITLSERATLDLRDPFNEAVAAFTNPTPKVPHRDIRWLSHLVAPPVLQSGMPGPRSLQGNVPFWLMPHNLASVLKWRLLPAGRATAAHKKMHTKASILAAAEPLFNEELPALRPEWGAIREDVNPQTLYQRRGESFAWMPATVMQAAASLRAYTSVSSDIEALVTWWQDQDFARSSITDEHPLFRSTPAGHIVARPASAGRELAEYLLGQAA